jgi:translation elongation factor P/translation initiation factor 5A
MVAASQLRSGMIIRFNSTLCQVLVPEIAAASFS